MVSYTYHNKNYLFILFQAEKETRVFLKSSISKYYAAKEKDAVTLMWDYFMANLQCCGVDSYEDFSDSKKWNEGKGNKTIPEACCVLEDVSKFQPKFKNCPSRPSDSNSYWKKVRVQFHISEKFIPQGATVDKILYKEILGRLSNSIRRKRPELWHRKNWLLLHDNAPAHRSILVQEELARQQMKMIFVPFADVFQGCYDAFVELIMENINIAIGIGIGLGLIQLLGIILAFCLCRSINGYIK
ncbi:hypothetical protein ANN_16591 [Periplaneta americana]|uniref:Uncharacterized protein n=1 Tax=Periplaneta americana TaxID=6978 RepID=A0ABQ8SQT3_PERAM|nr:hypothetical protein ANN_16591 [Periplaneta americana]